MSEVDYNFLIAWVSAHWATVLPLFNQVVIGFSVELFEVFKAVLMEHVRAAEERSLFVYYEWIVADWAVRVFPCKSLGLDLCPEFIKLLSLLLALK